MFDPALLTASFRISVPYAAGALGGTVTERSGTVNIAIEGLMLTGAFAFACAAHYCETVWFPQLSDTYHWLPLVFGILFAAISTAVISLIHAVTTITFKAHHILSGLALNLLALGLTDFLLQRLFGSASNSPRVPVFSSWNPIDPASPFSSLNSLFHPLIILLLCLVLLSHYLLTRTLLGLRMRAAGENPLAASAAGLRPERYRLYGILYGAVCASIGGVWLVSEQGLFSSNMTAGRGYIALAAVILGRWKPVLVAGVCLFFGFAEAVQNFLQVSRSTAAPATHTWLEQFSSAIPLQLIQALPYILTIIVVAGIGRKPVPPAALGQSLSDDNQ